MTLFQGSDASSLVQVKLTAMHKDPTGNKYIYIELAWIFRWTLHNSGNMSSQRPWKSPVIKRVGALRAKRKCVIPSELGEIEAVAPGPDSELNLCFHLRSFKPSQSKSASLICANLSIHLFVFSSSPGMPPHPWQQPVIRRIIQIVIWLHLRDTPWNHKQLGSAQSKQGCVNRFGKMRTV